MDVVGHAGADDKEGALVCAMISITVQTLWIVTNAVGAWKGPQGGEVRLRIPAIARHRGSLLSALAALFALVDQYPARVEVTNNSKYMQQLWEEWEQWLPPLEQRTFPGW